MIFAFDEFELDAARLELRRGPEVLKADSLVLRLLIVFVRSAGRLVTKEELVEQVWQGRPVADNVITVTVARLRKTLDDRRDERQMLATVYGRGYRFVRPVISRADEERPPSMLVEDPRQSRPLVGRERVLERLRSALNDARSGRGRVCLLLGEPGIGKTWVVDQLAQEIHGTQARVAWGFCREAGDTPPLAPWLRILRSMFESASRDEWRTRLGPTAATLEQLVDYGDLPSAAQVACFGDATSWTQRYEVVARALAQAARFVPWLLVLDDLHRADAASLELLAYLLDEIAHTSILIVATVRSSTSERAARRGTQLPHVLGHSACERIWLERLREADVRAYVREQLPGADAELGQVVFTKSEGHPFFMSELVKQLASEDADARLVQVPDEVLDIVRGRAERLAPATRHMLSVAAVVGRCFELWLLSAVSGLDMVTLMAGVDEAIASDLVVAAPDSSTGFAFGHELMRAALYEVLSPAEQRKHHLAVAHALEQRVQSGCEPVPPSALAFHYHAALPETDLAKTVHHCQEAARVAAASYANADVARYLRHALEALALMDAPSLPRRMSLLIRLALYRRAHARVFVPTIQEVVRLARALKDGAMLIKAAVLYVGTPELVHMPGSGAVLNEALALLSPTELDLRAVGLAKLACVPPQAFSRTRVRALLDQADELAHESRSLEARLICLSARLYAEGGPPEDGGENDLTEQLERLSRTSGAPLPMVPITVGRQRAVRALTQGDRAAGEAAFEAWSAGARQLRHSEMIWHVERARALGSLNAGQIAHAVDALEALHAQAEREGIYGSEPFVAFDRAIIGSVAGVERMRLDDAARRALAFDSNDVPSMWSLKVRALLAAGEPMEARASLAAIAPEDLAQLPHDSQYLGTLGHLAQVAVALPSRDYAEALYPLLAPYRHLFAGHVSFYCDGSIAQLRGMLAGLLGQRTVATSLLEEGIARAERARLPLAAAEARLALARLVRDEPRARPRAIALAEDVRNFAEAAGADGLARAASEILSGELPIESMRSARSTSELRAK